MGDSAAAMLCSTAQRQNVDLPAPAGAGTYRDS